MASGCHGDLDGSSSSLLLTESSAIENQRRIDDVDGNLMESPTDNERENNDDENREVRVNRQNLLENENNRRSGEDFGNVLENPAVGENCEIQIPSENVVSGDRAVIRTEDEAYLRQLLIDAQREHSNRSSRHSMICSSGNSNYSPYSNCSSVSPKSPPNSPNNLLVYNSNGNNVGGYGFNDWQYVNHHHQIENIREDVQQTCTPDYNNIQGDSWSSRPDNQPPKNWSFRPQKANQQMNVKNVRNNLTVEFSSNSSQSSLNNINNINNGKFSTNFSTNGNFKINSGNYLSLRHVKLSNNSSLFSSDNSHIFGYFLFGNVLSFVLGVGLGAWFIMHKKQNTVSMENVMSLTAALSN